MIILSLLVWGTTMTAITIDDDALMKIAHVGDSRCYVFSDRNLVKVTEDQNVPGYQNVLNRHLVPMRN